FLQHDPLGIDPAGGRSNRFGVLRQYGDAMSLYQYVRSQPISSADPLGLETKPEKQCKLKGDSFALVFDGSELSGGGQELGRSFGAPS
ncbi:MAG: hypothetical protein J7M40_00040, partial [Planctomycetes bacterium]|nr:hypothetical protein [Planctomycetota bacterium]